MKTEFVRALDLTDLEKNAHIARAGEIIRRGGLVVFPTETVYGLGADATQADAAARIYAAKGRPQDNPLIIHLPSADRVAEYAEVCPLFFRLADRFMPGPLTVILPVKPTIPATVTAGLSTVAVRVPSHPVAQAFLLAAGVPVCAPSANLSGSPSPTCARHVADDMDGRVDMILDGGESDIGMESTIVKIEGDGSLTLLRPGAITPEMLREVAPLHIAPAVLDKLAEGEQVLSPGLKYRHYAPRAPLTLLAGEGKAVATYLAGRPGRIAVLCYEEERLSLAACLPHATLYSLGSEADTVTQGHRLFYLLREADKQNYDEIFAPLPPTDGLGMALYNRMIRAAAHRILHL